MKFVFIYFFLLLELLFYIQTLIIKIMTLMKTKLMTWDIWPSAKPRRRRVLWLLAQPRTPDTTHVLTLPHHSTAPYPGPPNQSNSHWACNISTQTNYQIFKLPQFLRCIEKVHFDWFDSDFEDEGVWKGNNRVTRLDKLELDNLLTSMSLELRREERLNWNLFQYTSFSQNVCIETWRPPIPDDCSWFSWK